LVKMATTWGRSGYSSSCTSRLLRGLQCLSSELRLVCCSQLQRNTLPHQSNGLGRVGVDKGIPQMD
jgi:hypothetical protein